MCYLFIVNPLILLVYSIQEKAQGKARLANEIFTEDFAKDLCQVLITKYLIMSTQDLEMWENDPETFVTEEEADHWEFNIRVSFKLDSVNRFYVRPVR